MCVDAWEDVPKSLKAHENHLCCMKTTLRAKIFDLSMNFKNAKKYQKCA